VGRGAFPQMPQFGRNTRLCKLCVPCQLLQRHPRVILRRTPIFWFLFAFPLERCPPPALLGLRSALFSSALPRLHSRPLRNSHKLPPPRLRFPHLCALIHSGHLSPSKLTSRYVLYDLQDPIRIPLLAYLTPQKNKKRDSRRALSAISPCPLWLSVVPAAAHASLKAPCNDHCSLKNAAEVAPPNRLLIPNYRELISALASALAPTGTSPFKLSSICSFRYTSELMSYVASSNPCPCVIASVGQASTQYPQKMHLE
jgi:hypothetical protein